MTDDRDNSLNGITIFYIASCFSGKSTTRTLDEIVDKVTNKDDKQNERELVEKLLSDLVAYNRLKYNDQDKTYCLVSNQT